MSLKICTAEFMVSDAKGFGLSQTWLPRIVAERFVQSTRDGTVARAPDPVPFIDADLAWTNTSTDPQHLTVSVHRASRSLVTSDPNTLVFDDAVSWSVGKSPTAARPAAVDNGIGGRIKRARSTQNLKFSRLFIDRGDWVSYHDIGPVLPEQSIHFRYMCLFSTPGEWRASVQPRYEASARWARLRAFASPMISEL